MKNQMIYEFKTHGLYYERNTITTPNFSLAINALEIICELNTGKVLGAQGFFPIVNALLSNIKLPKLESRDYFITNPERTNYKQGSVYDLINKIPETKKYFDPLLIRFDKEKGIIQIGVELSNDEMGIKANRNIICGYDSNLILKSLYIMPDRFI